MKAFISFELYVSKAQEVAAFLEKHFQVTKEYGDNNFAILWLGKTRIILNELKLDEFQPPNPVLKDGALEQLGSGVEIVISVEDIEPTYKPLSSQQDLALTPLLAQPWGLRDFRFLLDDHFYVRVTEADKGVSEAW